MKMNELLGLSSCGLLKALRCPPPPLKTIHLASCSNLAFYQTTLYRESQKYMNDVVFSFIAILNIDLYLVHTSKERYLLIERNVHSTENNGRLIKVQCWTLTCNSERSKVCVRGNRMMSNLRHCFS